MSYLGIPPFGQTIRSVTNITATAGQTTFNILGGYQQGYVDVFLNGSLLVPTTDYTATNGLTVVLVSAAALNDEFQALSYQPVSIVEVPTKLVVLKRDTSTVNVPISNFYLYVTNRAGSPVGVLVS
jgi:hypothetical protein